MSARAGLIVVTVLLAVAGVVCLVASYVRHEGPVNSFGPPMGYTLAWFGVGLLAFAVLGLIMTLVVTAVTRKR